MNTTESNKLLAEFLGMELTTDGISQLYYTEDRSLRQIPKFQTDWNWLMQVVQKIESLGNDILITTNYIQIGFDEGEQFIVVEEVNVKIEAVYQAVLEFVNWYNEQKK
jgi:hypothetical protein